MLFHSQEVPSLCCDCDCEVVPIHLLRSDQCVLHKRLCEMMNPSVGMHISADEGKQGKDERT